ncbi:MAG: molybdopterin-dependent oxidoreductase, partial [Coriobacteriales bacterium]|nr:molybdopterin-dependent oxidoreductase [Coriobacteriales bacterium]
MGKPWKREGNGETIIRTCAWSPPGCHPVGCGLQLHVKDGKLVDVEGDPEHPITRGALCPRCLAIKDLVYHKDRIYRPQVRDPKDRGKNKWREISLDEAFDLLEEKLKYFSSTYGPESIVVFCGTGREATMFHNELTFLSVGSPNACYAQSGWSCYAPRAASTAYLMGGGYPEIDYASRYPDRYDHPGWQAPNYVVLWGKEPLKSNPDGLWGHSIVDMMKDCGTKLIVVDPRVTWIGTKAEIHLQLRPGTDAALALGMLNVIISENLYVHDAVDKWTYGFDELAERVKEYPPEKVAEITWVPVEQIYEAARKFAAHPDGKNSAIAWGLAVDQNPNGVQIGHALMGMLAITDNLDVPGGCTLGVPITDDINRDIAGRAMQAGILSAETFAKRIGAEEYPFVCDNISTNHPDCVLDTLETFEPYRLRVGIFQSSNVVGGAISAAQTRWLEAMKNSFEFAMATELFHNPTTMALCDLVIPLKTWVEHDTIVETHYGLNVSYQGACNKAVDVVEGVSDREFNIKLGKRMFPEYWNQFADEYDYMEKMNLPAGMSWKEFQERVIYQPEEIYRKAEQGKLRIDGQLGYMTQTGRFELWSTAYHHYGDDALPYFIEPPRSPVSTPELFEQYPLVLTTGGRSYTSFHSEHRQIDRLRQQVKWPLLEIHPDTAKSLGVEDGDWVW